MKTKLSNRGQGLVEYLILVCLVAVSAIAIVSVVGANIKEQYGNVSNSLRNSGKSVKLTEPNEEQYKQRGMNDFTEGAWVQP